MRRLLRWLSELLERIRAEPDIPYPPFRASKRTGEIMYGLWYGRLTPRQARARATAWGFAPEAIERMITEATKPPSYWSRQQSPGERSDDSHGRPTIDAPIGGE